MDLASSGAMLNPLSGLRGDQSKTSSTEIASMARNVVAVAGGPYSTLQAAIAGCSGLLSCVVDASDPTLGTQTLTSNPFAGLEMPITVITGPYTVQWDTSAFAVDIPSHFHWNLNGTTVLTTNPTAAKIGFGVGSGGMINTRITSTTGTMSAPNNVLLLADAARAEVGAIVGVMGASGANSNQSTSISNGGLPVDSLQPTIPVVSVSGWGNQENYLRIEDEYLRCAEYIGNMFSGCARGALGSTPSSHADQVPVESVMFLVSQITGVNGNAITIGDSAKSSVSSALVYIGSTDITFDGSGTLDGAQVPAAQTHFMTGLDIRLATSVSVGSGITFRNLEHGGIMMTASKFNNISGSYENNGKPAVGFGMGTDVTCFEQCSDNTVETLSHRNGNLAIMIDDRTDHLTFYSGISQNNVVRVGPVDTYLGGLSLEGGSSNNTVEFAQIRSSVIGIQIFSTQWTTNPKPSANKISFAAIDGGTGIAFQTLGYKNGDNAIIGGFVSAGTVSVRGDDFYTYTDANGFHGGDHGGQLSTMSMIRVLGSPAPGSPLVLVATVTSPSTNASIPTGTFKMYDGNDLLGTASVDNNGTATLDLSGLVAGSHTISAVYNGDANFTSSTTPPVALAIAPDFSLSASPIEITVSAGDGVTTTVSVSPLPGGFGNVIQLVCSGMPDESSCRLNPNAVLPGTDSSFATLLVSTTAPVSALYSRQLDHPIPLAFWFPMLGVSIIAAGTYRRKLLGAGGFAVVVSMLFVMVSCGKGDSGGQKPRIDPGTLAGTYPLTITAVSGAVQHKITITLVVTPFRGPRRPGSH
jgi:Big-like domain-containing protein